MYFRSLLSERSRTTQQVILVVYNAKAFDAHLHCVRLLRARWIGLSLSCVRFQLSECAVYFGALVLHEQVYEMSADAPVRTFDSDGFRLRAGCVCLSADRKQVRLAACPSASPHCMFFLLQILAISSSRSESLRWILPAGGVDPFEEVEAAALRETVEEVLFTMVPSVVLLLHSCPVHAGWRGGRSHTLSRLL